MLKSSLCQYFWENYWDGYKYTMFNETKYTRWYHSIVEKARSRSDVIGYVEMHHVIPRCMGGSNLRNNLVPLTAKEHFICHWLLTKMVDGVYRHKLEAAMSSFQCISPKRPRRVLSSFEYSKAREAMFLTAKETLWFTNGKEEIMAFVCPEDWKPGRLLKGKVSWTKDGTSVRSFESPGPEWVRGNGQNGKVWWNNGATEVWQRASPGAEWARGRTAESVTKLGNQASAAGKKRAHQRWGSPL